VSETADVQKEIDEQLDKPQRLKSKIKKPTEKGKFQKWAGKEVSKPPKR